MICDILFGYPDIVNDLVLSEPQPRSGITSVVMAGSLKVRSAVTFSLCYGATHLYTVLFASLPTLCRYAAGHTEKNRKLYILRIVKVFYLVSWFKMYLKINFQFFLKINNQNKNYIETCSFEYFRTSFGLSALQAIKLSNHPTIKPSNHTNPLHILCNSIFLILAKNVW